MNEWMYAYGAHSVAMARECLGTYSCRHTFSLSTFESSSSASTISHHFYNNTELITNALACNVTYLHSNEAQVPLQQSSASFSIIRALIIYMAVLQSRFAAVLKCAVLRHTQNTPWRALRTSLLTALACQVGRFGQLLIWCTKGWQCTKYSYMRVMKHS